MRSSTAICFKFFFVLITNFKSLFKVLSGLSTKMPLSTWFFGRRRIHYVLKSPSFSTHRTPKNARTVLFSSKDSLGFPKWVRKTTCIALGRFFHQIIVRQQMGREDSIQAVFRRIKGIQKQRAFFSFLKMSDQNNLFKHILARRTL
jgi:hypothetical protein